MNPNLRISSSQFKKCGSKNRVDIVTFTSNFTNNLSHSSKRQDLPEDKFNYTKSEITPRKPSYLKQTTVEQTNKQKSFWGGGN